MPRKALEEGTFHVGVANLYEYVYDDETKKGRYVVVPKTARKGRSRKEGDRWIARGTAVLNDGKRIRREATGSTQREAERNLADTFESELKTGGGTSHLKPTDTVKTLVTDWLENLKASNTRNPATITAYTAGKKNLVGDSDTETGVLGAVKIKSLNVARMRAALQTIANERGEGAEDTARKTLSLAYAYGIEHGIMPSGTNAVRSIPAVAKNGTKRRRPAGARAIPKDVADELIRLAELPTIHGNAKDATGESGFDSWKMGLLFRFLLATGARIGEVFATEWADVDLTGERAKVKLGHATITRVSESLELGTSGLVRTVRTEGETKEGTRVITLDADLTKRLKAEKETQELEEHTGITGFTNPKGVIFPNVKGGNYRDPRNETHHLRKIAKRAGAEWVTFHNFRDTVATRLFESNYPATYVAAFLGHSNPATTAARYLAKPETDFADMSDTLAKFTV